MKISINDEETHNSIVIQNFMKELCRRDNEANRDHNVDMNRAQNVFPVEDIRQQVLGGYTDIEYVTRFLREHRWENLGNEPFEFLDNEQNVRLTDAGRARCNQYGL